MSPAKRIAVQRLAKRLDSLDAEYKKQHLAVIDLIDGADALATEQTTLDELDDKVAEISKHCIESLILDFGVTSEGASTTIHSSVYLAKRLRYIEDKLSSIEEDFCCLTPYTILDRCLVQ